MQTHIPATKSWSDDRYDYREITISRRLRTEDARVMLTEDAEYGRWELAKTIVYYGGLRRVRLRRRTMQVRVAKPQPKPPA